MNYWPQTLSLPVNLVFGGTLLNSELTIAAEDFAIVQEMLS